jgi:hypothetical protein
LGLLLALGLLAAGRPLAAQAPPAFEVWAIDQADAANGGNRLYIFRGDQLLGGEEAGPEVVDLEAAATGVGDGPGVRPHLLMFNRTHTHGVLANVTSGHVLFIRAADRQVVASIKVGVQAHGAMPSADDRVVIVANQDGKRLARIRSDFVAERFVYEPEADLDLAALEDAEHPDNAPICPLLYGPNTNKVYVTVRGGGLYVVDTAATPMRVVREYGRSVVAPAGCGGVAVGDKVYINSGTATSSDLYVVDSRTDAILKHLPMSDIGRDAHGLVVVGNGRYLWMSFRASGNIAVIDTQTDEVVGSFLVGSGPGRRPNIPGAAPDIMDVAPGLAPPVACEPASAPMCLAPGGEYLFISMRGPTPLTGGMPARGDRTGIQVVRVLDDGRTGDNIGFIPLGGPGADIHGLAVRLLELPAR